MLAFIEQLRTLSGGKPVGFKLCIGHPWEFMAIVKAMLQTGVIPDFIVVDGAEGGTGAAPTEFSDHIGAPMREGLLFVHNTLVGARLRDKIQVGAAGKIVSAFDIASVLAIGADWTNAARGFMFAIGCVQSLSCDTNRCPTGVATQDAVRQSALVVPDKAERVYNFHRLTLRALADMLAAAGLDHPSDLGPDHLVSPRHRDRDPPLQRNPHLPAPRRTGRRHAARRLLRPHLAPRAGGKLRVGRGTRARSAGVPPAVLGRARRPRS